MKKMDGFVNGFEPRLSCEMNLQPLVHPLYIVAKGLFPIVYTGVVRKSPIMQLLLIS